MFLFTPGTEAAAGGERSAHKVTLLLPLSPGTEAHTTNALPESTASAAERTVLKDEKSTSTTTGGNLDPPASTPQEGPATGRRQREESESSLEDETEGEEPMLMTSRLDSTFSEASVDEEGLGKKRRRKHKKRRRASVADQLRGLNLRVMSK